MSRKFDIPINFTVIAEDERKAEQILQDHLRNADRTLGTPDIADWEFIEYVSTEQELAQSCCC